MTTGLDSVGTGPLGGTGPAPGPAPGPAAFPMILGAPARALPVTRPASAAGIALAAAEDGFAVVLVDAGGATLLRFGPFEEADVVALWRAMAAASGLPLLLRREDGAVECPFPQIGRLQLGRIRIRRRHGIGRRRPRFLARRKTGRLPGLPVIHRESELASGGT